MKTKQNYSYGVCNLFFKYYKGQIEQNDLILGLKNIQEIERKLHENAEEKSLWFKFGDNPLVYTIRDIDTDLQSKQNKELMIEMFYEAVNSDPDYLQINFS